ncbi:MAG: prepilin-type N-terminal cleavage/methylation domain-containing protein [Candidatus Curtissbacteria bacterium]|nr:prepilin-type N-terminal cleavage/methylation domain-containing protein [Candidatus Curtissbacteria bacterium]
MPFRKVNSEWLIVNRKKKKKKSIYHFPFTIHLKQGFTLVELLVGLGLLALTVGSALLFLTSVFRGSNQAAVITEVKQNGQSVLDSLERQIRGASDARQMQGGELPQGAINGLVLTVGAARTLYVACFSSTASVNGWIGLANMQTGAGLSLSDYKPLTNNASVIEGVDISTCSFSVVAATTVSPAIVSVKFTINQGVSAPSRSDFLSNAQFQTTISLRKY